MNGVLLFGWSTAVIFEVLRRTTSSEPRMGDKPKCKRTGSSMCGFWVTPISGPEE